MKEWGQNIIFLDNYHKGKDCSHCNLGNSVSKEKPQETIEWDHQKSINGHAHYLHSNDERHGFRSYNIENSSYHQMGIIQIKRHHLINEKNTPNLEKTLIFWSGSYCLGTDWAKRNLLMYLDHFTGNKDKVFWNQPSEGGFLGSKYRVAHMRRRRNRENL